MTIVLLLALLVLNIYLVVSRQKAVKTAQSDHVLSLFKISSVVSNVSPETREKIQSFVNQELDKIGTTKKQ